LPANDAEESHLEALFSTGVGRMFLSFSPGMTANGRLATCPATISKGEGDFWLVGERRKLSEIF
jgi:hypothetical protein